LQTIRSERYFGAAILRSNGHFNGFIEVFGGGISTNFFGRNAMTAQPAIGTFSKRLGGEPRSMW
jgi:hypothetical protein